MYTTFNKGFSLMKQNQNTYLIGGLAIFLSSFLSGFFNGFILGLFNIAMSIFILSFTVILFKNAIINEEEFSSDFFEEACSFIPVALKDIGFTFLKMLGIGLVSFLIIFAIIFSTVLTSFSGLSDLTDISIKLLLNLGVFLPIIIAVCITAWYFTINLTIKLVAKLAGLSIGDSNYSFYESSFKQHARALTWWYMLFGFLGVFVSFIPFSAAIISALLQVNLLGIIFNDLKAYIGK